jgi:hypothetical protein
MATTDMVMLRAENNTQGDDNGGFPINTEVDEATFFDKVFSAQDATEFDNIKKGIWWYKAASGSALYFDPQVWNNPAYDKGAHYVDFILSSLRETWADVFADLANRRRYGVGVLTQDASAGAQSITLRVKNPSQATGSDKIFYADGATLTDNLIIEGRSLPGSLDPAQFERIECDDVTSTVDDTTTYSWTTTIVTLHLSTPLVNSYVTGARVQTTPDQVDLIPTVDNVVKTGLNSTTFDETVLTFALGNLYNAGTWEDTLTITMQGTTGIFVISSLRYGAYPGTFDKTVSNSFTWSALGTSSPQINIPANTIGGTHVDGDVVTLQTHMAGNALFFRNRHPANAGTKLDTVYATGKWEE